MAIEKDKSIVATEVVDALNKKVNTSDVLTLGEIQESTDLTGKVASAGALKEIDFKKYTGVINTRYATGQVFAYSVNGIPRVMAQLRTTEIIPAWTSLIWNLPARPLNENFNVINTENTCLFQYHSDGFIQSAQDVPIGSHTIFI